MKFNIKTKPSTSIGDKKSKILFAFIPIKINNQYVFLERYIQLYEFKKNAQYLYDIHCSCVELCHCESAPVYRDNWVKTERKTL